MLCPLPELSEGLPLEFGFFGSSARARFIDPMNLLLSCTQIKYELTFR
jgi:hypothetical protein